MQNNIDFNFLNQHWAFCSILCQTRSCSSCLPFITVPLTASPASARLNCFICLLLLSVFGKERNFHLRLLADEDPSWLISHVDVVIVASHQDKHRPGPRLIEPIYFSTHCSVKYLSKKSFIFFVFFHSSDPSFGSMWNSEHFRAS